VAKDFWRIASRIPRAEPGWRSYAKVPLYLVSSVPFDLVALAGMLRAAAAARPSRQI
jgi:hypothetical protein